MGASRFVASIRDNRAVTELLRHRRVYLFEYFASTDTMVVYDQELNVQRTIEQYLTAGHGYALSEDRWQLKELLTGQMHGPLELREKKDGKLIYLEVDALPVEDAQQGGVFAGYAKDVTPEKEKERSLRQQAQHDPLTQLYNRRMAKTLIDRYLGEKDPYASCGLLVIDVDFFKNVNDRYGHLFGDKVLQEFARLLNTLFKREDVLARIGGDEFLVFMKDAGHSVVLKKARQLSEAVRKLVFEENDYCMTCSIGVCFLPENVSGYSYEQLFENADWALYQAKENGRNQYAFCDNLHRYAETEREREKEKKEKGESKEVRTEYIDARYLHNDLISTAFELFEKMNSFEAAIPLFLKIVGIRLQLDRITVINTDIKEHRTTRQFQWTSPRAPEVLEQGSGFTKEDFLTLFQSYDEYGTTVLQYDNMDMYSPDGAALLMQGGAKTVVYAAMYSEGEYLGAISYVVCGSKRFWTKQSRRELGEITKIINAYLTKHLAANAINRGMVAAPDFDRLTGLLSFGRFREEIEHKIVGGYADGHIIVYSDFENFKYFNEKYGYAVGDQVLKEFSNYLVAGVRAVGDVYMTRVAGDQFAVYLPYRKPEDSTVFVERMNRVFERQQAEKYPEASLRLRSGIYEIEPDCLSASAAIDKANFARKQLRPDSRVSVLRYDRQMGERQTLANELTNGLNRAMERGEFKLYLQPKFSLKDFSVIGAEALVRWEREDGTVLYPDQFIPILETTGRIVDLDLYMFEQVAEFLKRGIQDGLRLFPIAVNASVALAKDPENARRCENILQRHQVSAELLEIELTETAAVSEFDCVKKLFACFQEKKMQTSLDDFGAGYSVLNSVVDIPINTIKLDRGFIARCAENQRGIYFLQQVVNMVKSLGYQVICEGIETREQVDIMRTVGCDSAQGFWFSKAIPAEEFREKYMK